MPFVLSSYYLHIVTLALVYVALASSWNIVGGMAGQISLAHSLFIGIGAMLSSRAAAQARHQYVARACDLGDDLRGVWAPSIAWIDFRFQLGHLSFVLITLAFAGNGRDHCRRLGFPRWSVRAVAAARHR